MFPTKIPNFFGIVDASANFENSAALKNDSSAYTWGFNQYGNLGHGDQLDKSTPQLLPFNNVTKILCGFSTTSFQLFVSDFSKKRLNGSIYYSGLNQRGLFGEESSTTSFIQTKLDKEIKNIFSGRNYNIYQKQKNLYTMGVLQNDVYSGVDFVIMIKTNEIGIPTTWHCQSFLFLFSKRIEFFQVCQFFI
jgi:hypothetical protein